MWLRSRGGPTAFGARWARRGNLALMAAARSAWSCLRALRVLAPTIVASSASVRKRGRADFTLYFAWSASRELLASVVASLKAFLDFRRSWTDSVTESLYFTMSWPWTNRSFGGLSCAGDAGIGQSHRRSPSAPT